MDFRYYFFLFLGLIIGGVLIEALISQLHFYITKKHFKKYHFSAGRYIFLLLFPLAATLFLASRVGFKLINVFIAFAIVGPLIEWLIGFSYEMVVGHKLWSYYRYNINSYTSFLAIPLWGLAGVLFWLLAQAFN